MNKGTVITIAILGPLLAGCATYQPHEAIVREAVHERDEAYARLAKAITHYCTVSTDTLSSRQACMVEQHLSSLRIEQLQLAIKTPRYPPSPAE